MDNHGAIDKRTCGPLFRTLGGTTHGWSQRQNHVQLDGRDGLFTTASAYKAFLFHRESLLKHCFGSPGDCQSANFLHGLCRV